MIFYHHMPLQYNFQVNNALKRFTLEINKKTETFNI